MATNARIDFTGPPHERLEQILETAALERFMVKIRSFLRDQEVEEMLLSTGALFYYRKGKYYAKPFHDSEHCCETTLIEQYEVLLLSRQIARLNPRTILKSSNLGFIFRNLFQDVGKEKPDRAVVVLNVSPDPDTVNSKRERREYRARRKKFLKNIRNYVKRHLPEYCAVMDDNMLLLNRIFQVNSPVMYVPFEAMKAHYAELSKTI